jgi:hypothetical protein
VACSAPTCTNKYHYILSTPGSGSDLASSSGSFSDLGSVGLVLILVLLPFLYVTTLTWPMPLHVLLESFFV